MRRAALRLCSGRSALKSVHWTDLTGKPVGPHSTGPARPPPPTRGGPAPHPLAPQGGRTYIFAQASIAV